MTNHSAIEIFHSSKGLAIEVTLDNDTVWLRSAAIAQLFEVNRPAIVKHIANIYKSGELTKQTTCSILEQVTEDGKIRKVNYYNLDVIISAGYRVNSKKATQFRQWANQRLKDYLIKGYAINEERLTQLQKVVEIIEQTSTPSNLAIHEAKGLLQILSSYTKSFALLNKYDSNNLMIDNLSESVTFIIDYQEALKAISLLKKQLIAANEATSLFGNEKDDSFKSSLNAIVQTFDDKYLYPSIEEQAAHLLYFVIKNHSFTDGNKRIAAFLFVWFLDKNKHRLKPNGESKINDNGLAALAILVAQSNPNEKELMIQLIINLIN